MFFLKKTHFFLLLVKSAFKKTKLSNNLIIQANEWHYFLAVCCTLDLSCVNYFIILKTEATDVISVLMGCVLLLFCYILRIEKDVMYFSGGEVFVHHTSS